MKDHPILLLCIISALVAIAVVVVLKLLGQENATVIAGGVAGGIAGGISTSLIKKRKSNCISFGK